MSRIFEAIKRAESERNVAQEAYAQVDGEAVIAKPIEELSEPKESFDLRNIVQNPWNPSEASLPTLANRGMGVEQFRSLRSRIDQMRFQFPLKTILISSGMPAEGKTFVAANLAVSLARNTLNKVLLIDGDLRRGSLHRLLGAPNSPGLSEYLAGAAGINSILQRSRSVGSSKGGEARDSVNVTFIAAGMCSDNSSEVVSSHRMKDLVTILSPHFDWILIDSPPVLAVTDAVELARAADAVLLVARAASTPFDVAQRAQTAFSNSRILGFVLNAIKKSPHSESYSYYYGLESGSGSRGR